MNADHITYSRQSFAIMRWTPLVMAAVLPFTFGHGLIPTAALLGAVLCACFWVISILLHWRTGRNLWSGIGFCSVILFPNIFEALGPHHLPSSQANQWICLLFGLAGLPLLFFRKPLLRFARLDDSGKTSNSVAATAGRG